MSPSGTSGNEATGCMGYGAGVQRPSSACGQTARSVNTIGVVNRRRQLSNYAGSRAPTRCVTFGRSAAGVHDSDERTHRLRTVRSITAIKFRSSQPRNWPMVTPAPSQYDAEEHPREDAHRDHDPQQDSSQHQQDESCTDGHPRGLPRSRPHHADHDAVLMIRPRHWAPPDTGRRGPTAP